MLRIFVVNWYMQGQRVRRTGVHSHCAYAYTVAVMEFEYDCERIMQCPRFL
ncbi:dextranase [Salmonella phage 19]|nr:dextranase [Salmonella phage 19]